jgi:hypothetical protein
MLGFLILATVARADDPASQDRQVVKSKAVSIRAASVNFKKELGMSYRSLGTLGARIDADRRASQVISIAHPTNPTIPTMVNVFGTEDTMSTWGPRGIWGQFNKYTWNIK